MLVVQGDQHNESRLATTVVAALTSNVDLARVPGNVLVPAALSGLSKDSVVNVSALATVDRGDLVDPAGAVPPHLMDQVDDGLRVLLAL